MAARILGKGEVVGSIPTGSTTFPPDKSVACATGPGKNSERKTGPKRANRAQIRAKSVQGVQPFRGRSP